MKKAALALLSIIAIGVGAYVYTQRPAMRSGGEPSLSTAEIQAATAAYTVDVQYPQFGNAHIDAQIRADVERAVAEFEALPPNPPDSAAAQSSFTGRFDKVYIGPDVVSVELILSQYTGGAHDITLLSGENFDRTTGIKLGLEDALRLIGMTVQQVSASSSEQFRQKLGDAFFSDGASDDPNNFSSFVISKDAVTFIFQEYQVAAFAAGPQFISFPRK